MVYQVNRDGNLWHADSQKFPSKWVAIRHLTEKMGREGRIEITSADRIEVHFDGVSRFSPLAG